MRRFLFLLLFFTTLAQAEIIHIPDANLKAKLLSDSVPPLNIIAASEALYMQGAVVVYTTITNIDSNHNGEIELEEALLVKYLNISNSNITNLEGLQHFSNLRFLNFGNNPVEHFGLYGLPLESLAGFRTQLTEINVSYFSNLKSLILYNNHLTDLDVSQNSELANLVVTSNELTKLDVTYNPNLRYLKCSNNNIGTLLMKNGSLETSPEIVPNPGLAYICADEGQVDSIKNQVGPDVEVNPYCFLNPGGDIFTVLGTVRWDADGNDCDDSDEPQPNISIHFSDANTTAQTFSDVQGDYSIYTLSGFFQVSASTPNPEWFTVSPNTVSILPSGQAPSYRDFCIAPNGFHPDIEVAILPLMSARPGSDAEYLVTYTNNGNVAYGEGLLNFQYDGSVLDYVSSTENVFSQSDGVLSWQYNNLRPFESRSVRVRLKVNAANEVPVVNLGDQLTFLASSFPLEADETPFDNSFTYRETVTDLILANHKTCLEGDVIASDRIGNYLHYHINFENTGTIAAGNVVVRDLIDAAKFDLGSLQVLNASHPMTTRISGNNKVEFLFENINLAPAARGNVAFKIRTRPNLTVGTIVSNQASIYFDYNFPVITNTATSTFELLSNADFTQDNAVAIYPNPATNRISVTAESIIKSIAIYDMQGRTLGIDVVNQPQAAMDVSRYPKGIYFLKVTTDKGLQVQRVIKE